MLRSIFPTKFVTFSFSLGFSILAASNVASAATPSEAFQRADYLGKIVEKLLESDLLEPKLSQDPPASPSRPRHVLRLATYAYENVQYLKNLNGLGQDKPVVTAPKNVKPSDVIQVLNAAINASKSLAKIYNVDLTFAEPAVIQGKKPSDVLARIRSVNKGLVQLGAPKTLPNDVYRIALGINEQAKSMTKSLGISVEGEAPKVKKASPANALDEVIGLISDLDTLSKSGDRFALPKGVITPPIPKKGDRVTPGNVLIATQYALADVYSLNIKLGGTEALVLPPAQSGRNPADVKNVLAEARQHLNALTNK